MRFKWRVLRMISPALLMVTLTGCAQFDKVWHNREYNYLRDSVSQHAELKTPPGLKSIKSQPKYTLPPGPQHYPATRQQFDMAPPGLDKVYTPSELKQMKALQGQTKTHLQPLPATKTGLLERIDQLKAQLHKHQSTPGQSVVAPTAVKTDKSQTRQQKLKSLKQQLADVQHKLETLHQQPAKSTSAVSSQAVSKPAAVDHSTIKAAAQPAIPSLSSDLSRNDSHQAILKVSASFKSTWQKIGQVLPAMHYKVRDTEKTDGVYFIAPINKKAVGHTIVLSVQPQGDRHTQVQIYNTQGEIATSRQSYQLLHQLQQQLKAP